MTSPYFFSSLDRRPDFVDSAALHPRMETPPVWAELEREEVDEAISPMEWVLFVVGFAAAVIGSYVWPYWIAP